MINSTQRVQRVQRHLKRIEVNDIGGFITLDFEDPELPYRYYKMLKRLGGCVSDLANSAELPDGDSAVKRLEAFAAYAIDDILGKNTCFVVYGDLTPTLEMHIRFFNALLPYFQEEGKRRRARMNKYSAGRMGDVKRNS